MFCELSWNFLFVCEKSSTSVGLTAGIPHQTNKENTDEDQLLPNF